MNLKIPLLPYSLAIGKFPVYHNYFSQLWFLNLRSVQNTPYKSTEYRLHVCTHTWYFFIYVHLSPFDNEVSCWAPSWFDFQSCSSKGANSWSPVWQAFTYKGERRFLHPEDLDPLTCETTGLTGIESAWYIGYKFACACRYMCLCIQVHNDISTLCQFSVEKKCSDFSHRSQFPHGGIKYMLKSRFSLAWLSMKIKDLVEDS